MAQINSLIHRAVAPSTRRVYAAGVRRFRWFCSNRGLNPLPATELTIRLFCTEESQRVTGSTITTYVAAVCMDHFTKGLPDPTANAPLLSLLLAGIKRTGKATNRTRLPITGTILKSIKTIKISLRTLYSSHDRHLFGAALTLAFYGFMRVSEYAAPARSRATTNTLTARQVTLTRDTLTVQLKRSKTSQLKSPPLIHVGTTHDATCVYS